MKLLYASYRYDPTHPDLGSSTDYENFNLCKQAGFEVSVVGPIAANFPLVERAEQKAWRLYKKIFGKSGLKFPLTTIWRAGRVLHAEVARVKPDVIFAIFPQVFVFYNKATPYVVDIDATFLGQEEYWPDYGNLPLRISVWQEKRAFSRAAKIITKSEWSQNILAQKYGIPLERIEIIPSFAALPEKVIPPHIHIEQEKSLGNELRLLLVGRVYQRKGIDVAIEAVQQLNAQGVSAQLTVCGMDAPNGERLPFVQFVGNYKKSDPAQLQQYVDWYRWAHLLIHPARFEAAGIVPSEAAAFATPTITNNNGGLATTVKHGESGIVLPRNSPPEAYVQAIRELIANPERYYALCKSTRARYEHELNSRAAGERLGEILRGAAVNGYNKKDDFTCNG